MKKKKVELPKNGEAPPSGPMTRSDSRPSTAKEIKAAVALYQIADPVYQTIKTFLGTSTGNGGKAIAAMCGDPRLLNLTYPQAESVFEYLKYRLFLLGSDLTDDLRKRSLLSHLDYLKRGAKSYFVERIESEWEEKDPEDLVYYLERWQQTPRAISGNELWDAIKIVQLRSEKKIESERKWIKNKKELADYREVDQTTPDEMAAAKLAKKRGLTINRAIMFMECIASRFNSLSNEKKADILALFDRIAYWKFQERLDEY